MRIILIVLFGFIADSVLAEDVAVTLSGETSDSKITLRVSLADERAERERGLRFVTDLTNDGMLFVFEEEGVHRVWAKDTFLTLSMFWFSADGRFLGETQLTPFDLTIHSSPSDVKFGLEIERVLGDELNIDQGSVMTISAH